MADLPDAVCTALDTLLGTPPGASVCVRKVVQINAKVEGTHGLRNPGNKRPDNVLASSGSDSESLATNTPVILVRGCKKVQLEAVTSPHNLPVTWVVKPNENTDPAPALVPKDGGKKAELSTNVHGSFSVIATLDGTKVVWNVVFVWVKVDVRSSSITRRDNKYADDGSGGGWTNFRSGQFFIAGQYPWEAKVNVKVVGGGNSKRLGTNKVRLHVLQNGVADTLTGHYAPPPAGATAKEVPKGGFPVRDSNGGGVNNTWMDTPTTFKPNNTDFRRTVWTGDSPAGGFPTQHQNTGKALQKISGINGFTASIASVSSDAPTAFMVHAKTSWAAHFNGTVNAAGMYTPAGAFTTVEKAFALISPATGGQDACDAGFETFEPRFNGGTDTNWNP